MKIAHRGYKYIDNTILAFENAIKEGFDMIELDIQLCKSGEIVIYHDIIINNRYIIDITLEELRKFNIVTFDDFLAKIDITKIKIYLDLKGCDRLADVLMLYLENIDLTNIYIGSFNRKHLHKLLNKNLKLGYITENCFTNDEIDILTKNMTFISFNWSITDEDLITYCKSKGLLVFVYTIKNISEYELISNFKIDGVVSDIKI